jgi:(+)-trans-carveol dehydrogenase
MADRLTGKVAFITGAARGQGRSHAIRLAEEGADIIAIDLCAPVGSVPYAMAAPEDLSETVSAVESLDRRIIARVADVRDGEAVQAAVDDGVATLGRLDIVSANAGISSMSPADTMSEQQWQDMIDINLTGVWHTAKAAIPHIRAGGRGGAIVMTSSVAGLTAMPNIAHYVAAKHGVVGLMKALALELAPDMIRVNSLHPTQVETPMIMNDQTKRLFVPGDTLPSDAQFAEVSQSMNALPIPWVQAVDISNALVFLASDEGRYVTGVTLAIDAGAILK